MIAPTPTVGGWPVHCAVLASAGTGKTHQLSTRFIALLAAGRPPETILATTFTRKAAGEILGRVLQRLALAATDDGVLKSLNGEIAQKLSRGACADLASGLARGIHRIGVMTLDSWFGRVASGFGLELGLPAAWSILDDRADDEIRSEAVRDALDQADHDEMIGVLEALSAGKARRGVHRAILSAVGAAYEAFLDSAGGREVWQRFGPGDAPPTREEALAALGALRDALTKEGKPRKNWGASKGKIAAFISALDFRGVLDVGLVVAVIEGKAKYDFEAILEEDRAALAPAIAFAAGACLEELRQRNAALYELLGRFDACYRRRKQAAGRFRFDDLPRRMMGAALEARLDEMYYRLDARLHHLLLDEFQDTSRVQYAVLAPVLDELLAVGDGSRSVFCVGDEKQSLYAWRGAEPELLRRLPERYPHAVASRELRRSFRSSPVVLDAVNAVFGSLDSSEALRDRPRGGIWSHPFPAHEAVDQAVPGAVRLLAGPDSSGMRIAECHEAIARFAAARVKVLRDRCPEASIGVLVRANKRIAPLIRELRALGLDAAEEGGSRLTDAEPVAAALSLLHLAQFPGDTAALFHVGACPLGRALGIDPLNSPRARHAAALVRRQLALRGFADTLARWQRLCVKWMDAHGFNRFDRLIDLARRFDADAGRSPRKFVELAERTTVEDPRPAAVRVMTVHASKGLEFDCVVLPDLAGPWTLSPGAVAVERAGGDPLGPVTAATLHAPDYLCRVSPGLDRLFSARRAACIDGELCALYVAMTRARFVLEMIVPGDGKDRVGANAGGVLRAALAPGVAAKPLARLWASDGAESAAWPAAVRKRLARKQSPARPEPPAVELKLPAKGAVAAPVWKLPRESPSALEGADAVDLGAQWLPRSGAMSRGRLIHLWLSQIEWVEDAPVPQDALLAIAAGEGLAREDAAAHLPAFAAALAAIRPVLSRERYPGGAEVRREWAFAVRDTDPVSGRTAILSGQIDRLVISRDARGAASAEVVDFKTDAVPGAEAFRAAVALYSPQVNAYRRAASRLLGVPIDRVQGTIVFTATGDLAPVG